MSDNYLDLRIGVVGGTGQIGYPLSEKLLKLGAQVIVISCKRTDKNNDKLERLKAHGAELEFCGAYDNVGILSEIFSEIDTIVMATQDNVNITENVENEILKAARIAGVKRFLPSEFGIDMCL